MRPLDHNTSTVSAVYAVVLQKLIDDSGNATEWERGFSIKFESPQAQPRRISARQQISKIEREVWQLALVYNSNGKYGTQPRVYGSIPLEGTHYSTFDGDLMPLPTYQECINGALLSFFYK